MAVEIDPYKLSSPRIYLIRMVVFLILVGFAVLILYKQIALAFSRNPGLNGLIFFVLFIGIVLALRQVIRLFREVRWVNALPRGLENEVRQPILLGPIATLIGGRPVNEVALPTLTLRAVLDSIGSRLDEARDTSRYLTGLLIFLGLLGTFWGPADDCRLDRRHSQFHAGGRRCRRDVRQSQEQSGATALGHEHFVHLVALRSCRLAGAWLFSICRRDRRKTASITNSKII